MLLGIRWRSLRLKIIAWSFVPTVIILVAVALFGFNAYQQVTEKEDHIVFPYVGRFVPHDVPVEYKHQERGDKKPSCQLFHPEFYLY